LLPSALDGLQPLALLPWMALSVGLFITWHRFAGWWSLRSRRHRGSEDPRLMVQAALLGIACSLVYVVSGSLWSAVLLHWLGVVAWREWLAGHKQLRVQRYAGSWSSRACAVFSSSKTNPHPGIVGLLGDVFEIQLSRKQIKNIPLGAAEEE